MEIERYERHIALHSFSANDHYKIKKSWVLVIGLGGVGVHAVSNLAGFGVNLGICDNDVIEKNNLNRQFIYNESGIGKKKADECEVWIKKYNSDVHVSKHYNIESIDFTKFDIAVDCTDNINSRIEISKLCKQAEIPLVYASAVAYTARVGVFFRRYLHEMAIEGKDDDCSIAGIFPPAAGIAGCIAGSECVKILTEKNTENKMIILDLEKNLFKVINLNSKT